MTIPRTHDPGDSNENVVWRPLSHLEVVFTQAVAYISPSEAGVHVIDLGSLLQIMELIQDGAEIVIKDREGVDLITLSQEFHKLV